MVKNILNTHLRNPYLPTKTHTHTHISSTLEQLIFWGKNNFTSLASEYRQRMKLDRNQSRKFSCKYMFWYWQSAGSFSDNLLITKRSKSMFGTSDLRTNICSNCSFHRQTDNRNKNIWKDFQWKKMAWDCSRYTICCPCWPRTVCSVFTAHWSLCAWRGQQSQVFVNHTWNNIINRSEIKIKQIKVHVFTFWVHASDDRGKKLKSSNMSTFKKKEAKSSGAINNF